MTNEEARDILAVEYIYDSDRMRIAKTLAIEALKKQILMKQGKWMLYENDDADGMTYFCSACNFQLSEDLFYSGYKNGKWIENNVFKYCPNCGAYMRGDNYTDGN